MDGSSESLEERTKGRKKEVDVRFAADENDNSFALIGECCGNTPGIHQLSPRARVSLGGEIYILECVGTGFIRLEP